MAFNNKGLSVIAYANGFTLWHYTTNDTLLDIKNTPDYFPKVAIDLMACGDIMIINAFETTDILAIKTLDPFVFAKLGDVNAEDFIKRD